MGDLLSAFNGAIPVGALRSKVLHNRQNKIVIAKVKPVSVVKGKEIIIVEKIEDDLRQPAPAEKMLVTEEIKEESIDTSTVELVKLSDTEEVNEPKQKRKYSRHR